MIEIIEAIAGVVEAITSVWDLISGLGNQIKEEVTEITDIFVQGGTEIIGFADAVSEPINGVKDCLSEMLPANFVVMVGIALTAMIALATRRSMNA